MSLPVPTMSTPLAPARWPRLRAQLPFDPATTLLVDDTLPILRTARDYGIAWLVAIRRPDSGQPPRPPGEFPAIQDFSELWPTDGPTLGSS